jgi:tRNA pseudouridine55 synthase
MNDIHGLLVIDKPLGMTSRAAVEAVARWFPRGTKVGHTGTLDPLATGVLVLCIGSATRLADFIQAMPKSYESEFTLGATSATDDAEGPIERDCGVGVPSHADIESALPTFIGDIEQSPPAYSAVKVAGQRAYRAARRGRDLELASRRVRIDAINVLDYRFPCLRLQIDCGKGTYIRSLARDLGRRLGCGGYVSQLRRSRVGSFSVDQAVSMDSDPSLARTHLRPVSEAVAQLPAQVASADEIIRLRHGQCIQATMRYDGEWVAVFDAAGQLLAVARPTEEGSALHPERVLPA